MFTSRSIDYPDKKLIVENTPLLAATSVNDSNRRFFDHDQEGWRHNDRNWQIYSQIEISAGWDNWRTTGLEGKGGR